PADAYLPLQFSDSIGDQGMNTRMIARLKPAVTIVQAQTELNTMFQRFPSKDSRVFVGDYERWLAGDLRASLILLFGAAGLLLFLACLNIANLLLSRATFRGREIFIRTRSEEHTSELQSPCNIVCRLLLEKKQQPRILE